MQFGVIKIDQTALGAERLQPWQPHGQDSKDKIAVCLSCPLPDCFGTEHPECPIKRQRNRARK